VNKKISTYIALSFAVATANATVFGPVENFDVTNGTGHEAHGFEIEMHGIHKEDVSSIFGDDGTVVPGVERWKGMERYDVPTMTETVDAQGAPLTVITYKAKYVNGAWSVGTAPGALANAPGDSCWPLGDPTYNTSTYPCDHFGVSTNIPATSVNYNWLIESGTPGTLVASVVDVPAPVWNVVPQPPIIQPQPPINNVPQPDLVIPQPPKVDVKVEAPDPINLEFGKAVWMKVTASGVMNKVEVGDLVQNNQVVRDAKNQVQVEWQLLQKDSGSPGSGVVDLTGVQLDQGAQSIVYTFESYEYTGAIDPATGEAKPLTSDTPAQPDPGDLGNFIALQMAAANFDAAVAPPPPPPIAPTLNATFTDAVVGQPYSQVIDVTPGVAGDVVALTVTGLPAWATFNGATNTVSGTPGAADIATSTLNIKADDVTNGTTISASVPLTVTDAPITFAPVLPDATVGTFYSLNLSATGGTGSFTFLADVLPAGLTLASSGVLSGTPLTVGNTPITLTANDGYTAKTASANLLVNPAAVVPIACSGTDETIFNLGRAGWFSTATNQVKYPDAAHTTLAPGMITFGNGDAASYSGNMDQPGVFCVADTMSVAHPFTVNTPVFANGQAGVAYTPVAITPAGGWSPYTIVVSGLPNGLTFDGTNVIGTPTVSGKFPITVSIADNKGHSINNTTLSITIDTAPAVNVAATLSAGTVGVNYNANVSTSGGIGNIALTQSGLPAGLVLNGNVISGKPTASGTFNVTFTGTDSFGTKGTATASLVINPAVVVPPPACPTSGKSSVGQYKVVAVGASSLTMSNGKVVNYLPCTTIQWNRKTQVFKIGDSVEWKGYIVNGSIVANKLTVN
jgi:Putative Ig domain